MINDPDSDPDPREMAFEQIHFRAIFENQREKLKETLEGDLIYPHNGGFFILNASLFFEVKMYIDESRASAILLDINSIPVKIANLKEFLKETRAIYAEALNRYNLGFIRLKKSRKVPTLTKLHDLEDDVEE